MRVPATRSGTSRSNVFAIISVADGQGAEIFLSGNFGQALTAPSRDQPKRLYPIEPILRRERRFAINVLAASQRAMAIRLINVRRRVLDKARIVGIAVERNAQYGIPHLEDCLHTLFCEIEQVIDTGDHTVMIAVVLDSRRNPLRENERPLLYDEVSGSPGRYPRLSKAIRAGGHQRSEGHGPESAGQARAVRASGPFAQHLRGRRPNRGRDRRATEARSPRPWASPLTTANTPADTSAEARCLRGRSGGVGRLPLSAVPAGQRVGGPLRLRARSETPGSRSPSRGSQGLFHRPGGGGA